MLKIVHLLVCVVLMCVVGPGYTMTLGNLRGPVLLGRLLNVTVPVQLDTGETASSVCAEVQVSFADNQLDSARVRNNWQPVEGKSEGLLRVETTVAIDEPVVSLLLHVGCVRKTTRKYVVLVDLPNHPVPAVDTVLPVASATSPVAASSPVGVQVVEATQTPVKVLPASSVKRSSQRPLTAFVGQNTDTNLASLAAPAPMQSTPIPRRNAKVAPLPSRPVDVGTVKTLSQGGGTKNSSRLQLSGVYDGLKVSTELATTPTDDDQIRVDARALWRSLNATPEEAVRDAQKRQAMEAQLKALQADASKKQQANDTLKSQLVQAEDERYTNALVAVLAASLLCALAGVGYLVFRLRVRHADPDKRWWRSESSEPSILSDLASTGVSERSYPTDKEFQEGRSRRMPGAESGIDESLFDGLRASSAEVPQKARWQSTPSQFMSPRSGFFHSSLGIRSVNVEELFDIQQQAEFFVSLGQHEQAMDLLQQHIGGTHNTSGLVYLDLLQLYHQFNRRADYDRLREEFNSAFNAQVPTFENNLQQSRGIERYSDVLARVQASWQSPEILDVLQDLIFRKPESDEAQWDAFDLTAYRELMLLFAIAKDLAEGSLNLGPDLSAESPHGIAKRGQGSARFVNSLVSLFESPQSGAIEPHTSPAGSPHELFAASQNDPVQTIALPKPSPKLGLDVDLFELESIPAPADETGINIDLDFSIPLAEKAAPVVTPNLVTPSKPAELMEFDIGKYVTDDKVKSTGLKIKSKKP